MVKKYYILGDFSAFVKLQQILWQCKIENQTGDKIFREQKNPSNITYQFQLD